MEEVESLEKDFIPLKSKDGKTSELIAIILARLHTPMSPYAISRVLVEVNKVSIIEDDLPVVYDHYGMLSGSIILTSIYLRLVARDDFPYLAYCDDGRVTLKKSIARNPSGEVIEKGDVPEYSKTSLYDTLTLNRALRDIDLASLENTHTGSGSITLYKTRQFYKDVLGDYGDCAYDDSYAERLSIVVTMDDLMV